MAHPGLFRRSITGERKVAYPPDLSACDGPRPPIRESANRHDNRASSRLPNLIANNNGLICYSKRIERDTALKLKSLDANPNELPTYSKCAVRVFS